MAVGIAGKSSATMTAEAFVVRAAALFNPFFDHLRQRIPQLTVNPRTNEVPIVSSRYGSDSGIAGGAALCA